MKKIGYWLLVIGYLGVPSCAPAAERLGSLGRDSMIPTTGEVASVEGRVTDLEGGTNNWNTAYGWGDHAGLYLGLTDWATESNLLWQAIAGATDTNALQISVFTTYTNAAESRFQGLETNVTVLTESFQTLETNAVLRTDLDGGWYYPDWFSWSFAQVADGVPDTTSTLTNNDVIIERSIYSAQGGSWDIEYSGLRSADFIDPAVTSASPSVATCTVDKVWYVSPGEAAVTATVGNFQRSTNLTMELVSSLTNEAVSGCVTGSAVCAFADAIDSRLTDGTDKAVYSTQDHDTPEYVRNTNSWVADLDLTCISPWNSTGGRTRAGTLIGSDCIIFANHYPIGVGATIRFVGATNQIVTRTISSRMQISYTDIMIAKLSAAISTNDCRPALLLPGNESDYMPYNGSYGVVRPAVWIDQYENAYTADFNVMSSYANFKTPTDSTRLLYAKFPLSGDSGSAALLVDDSQRVILIGAWWGAYAAPSVSYYTAEIRAAAAALGCDTNSIVDADFEAAGYTNFAPLPPTPGE